MKIYLLWDKRYRSLIGVFSSEYKAVDLWGQCEYRLARPHSREIVEVELDQEIP